MTTTLADLLVARSADTHESALLAALTGAGFPVTDWIAGSPPRELVAIEAAAHADFDTTIAAIAAGGFIDIATDAWLTLLAAQVYGLTRTPATYTTGTVRLTAVAGSSPGTIIAGQVWVSTAAGKRFVNTTGGVLTAGSYLDVTVCAESSGTGFNVPQHAIAYMVTTLAGVTCDNQSASWILTTGLDEELDAALRLRCQDRWPTLGTGATEAVYRLWAETASTSVTRVLVETGASGAVDIYVAGAAESSGGVVSDVQAYIAARAPLCVLPTAHAATGLAFDVTATITCPVAQQTAAIAGATASITAYLQSVPIGGWVYLAKIIELLMQEDGVITCVPSVPDDDYHLTAHQVATAGTFAITGIEPG